MLRNGDQGMERTIHVWLVICSKTGKSHVPCSIKIVSIGEGGKGKVKNIKKQKKKEGNQDKIIQIAVHYYRYSPLPAPNFCIQHLSTHPCTDT